MAKTVIGIFKNENDAEETIAELKNTGYDTRELSVIMRDYRKTSNLKLYESKMANGAASGATAGAIIGGLAGIITGLGIITVPGLGPFLLGGPAATIFGLTGAAAATVTGAASGALAGGLIGGLIALGIPEKVAKKYEEYIRAGGILLIVPIRDRREDEVREIFTSHRTVDLKTLELPKNPDHIKTVDTMIAGGDAYNIKQNTEVA